MDEQRPEGEMTSEKAMARLLSELHRPDVPKSRRVATVTICLLLASLGYTALATVFFDVVFRDD